MNYHLMPDDKFVDGFIEGSESITGFKNEYFVLSDKLELKWVKSNFKFNHVNNIDHFKRIIEKATDNDKIFFHGFDQFIINLVATKNIKGKIFWIVWGWELYDRLKIKTVTDYSFINSKDGNFIFNWFYYKLNLFYRKFKKEEMFRKFLLKLTGVLHYNKHDIALLNQQYSTNISMIRFSYKNLIDWKKISKYSLEENKLSDKKLKILLGNSGTLSNNHFDIINYFSKMRHFDFEIYCPLSYGDKKYIDKLIKFGNGKLPKRFFPITDFMNSDKYLEFLSKMDIGIMNHMRSQAMANIVSLLSLGKNVVINHHSTNYLFLKELGISFFSVSEFLKNPFIKLSQMEKQKNKNAVSDFFSDDNFISNLKTAYNY